ncbi:hypothetical protein QTH97_36330 [Variovorax sp. J22R24]|uniref:hypothetical protein n=1 Tax=Variovorax gracilis TaxID=3053502 RepID=UPI002574DF7A|nr:hypothetical protein [Variovorax sp. J22R24]MDM0110400.1 hypothetical protein [Variovorax sp. J22R24]
MALLIPVTLLELSDTLVLLAGRRVGDLVRRAAGKAGAKRVVDTLDYRVRFKSVTASTLSWRRQQHTYG